MQLLGTAPQVDAAHRFAEEFVNNGGADTGSILNELRDDLRADLDLGPLPNRRTHLRITMGSEQADIEWSENARISAEAITALQRAAATPAAGPSLGSSEAQPDASALVGAASIAWDGLQLALADSLEAIGGSVGDLGLDGQLNLALERGLISEKTLKGIAGLNVMWSLLLHDAHDGRLTTKRSEEFIVLATALRGLFDAGIAGPVVD